MTTPLPPGTPALIAFCQACGAPTPNGPSKSHCTLCQPPAPPRPSSLGMNPGVGVTSATCALTFGTA